MVPLSVCVSAHAKSAAHNLRGLYRGNTPTRGIRFPTAACGAASRLSAPPTARVAPAAVRKREMSGARAGEQSGEPDATLRQLAETALRDEESWARLVHAEEEALARALPPWLPAPLRPKPSTPPPELTPETSDARRDGAVAAEPSAITETGQPPAEAAPRPPSTPTLQPPPTAQPVPTTTTPRPPAAKLDLTDLFGDKGRTPRAESRAKAAEVDLFSGQAGGSLFGSSSARGTQPARKGGSLFGDADDPLFLALLSPK